MTEGGAVSLMATFLDLMEELLKRGRDCNEPGHPRLRARTMRRQ